MQSQSPSQPSGRTQVGTKGNEIGKETTANARYLLKRKTICYSVSNIAVTFRIDVDDGNLLRGERPKSGQCDIGHENIALEIEAEVIVPER